jgi:DNA-binding response OmpR family regulator
MINLKNYTILYAEDETIIRLNLNRFFEKNFKKVLLAKDGEEALELIDKHNPQILVLDIEMPYYTGLEVAKIVRQYNKEIPIVMVTAHSDTSTLLKAIELNLNSYLIKPITQSKLYELLYKLQKYFDEKSHKRLYLSENNYWDCSKELLYNKNSLIELSVKEKKLLALFANNLNQNIYYEDIMAYVWEEKFDEEISIASIKNIVSNLRKKLPKDSLKNIYGKGYILTKK